MLIRWSDVTALQANLSSVDSAAQMIILAHVNEDLNPAAFGGDGSARYHLVRCTLAAHMGELERRNGERAVTGKTISTSAMTLQFATSDEGLALTNWGSAYKGFLLASPLRFGVTR